MVIEGARPLAVLNGTADVLLKVWRRNFGHFQRK
jgi:hypothetical protein